MTPTNQQKSALLQRILLEIEMVPFEGYRQEPIGWALNTTLQDRNLEKNTVATIRERMEAMSNVLSKLPFSPNRPAGEGSSAHYKSFSIYPGSEMSPTVIIRPLKRAEFGGC